MHSWAIRVRLVIKSVKILYLSHRIPYPPDKGEKIRTFHQVKHLSKKHTIHLCTFIDDPNDLPGVAALESYCASVEAIYRARVSTLLHCALGSLTGQPLSVAAFTSALLRRKIVQRCSETRIDCILVSSSCMAQYVSSFECPKILDFIDVDSDKWRTYAKYRTFPWSRFYLWEAIRLARYEEQMAHVFDQSVVVSDPEKQLLAVRAPGCRIAVISNGVDLEYYTRQGVDQKRNCHNQIVFTGAMDYFPNVDAVEYFCHEIFPRVREKMPDAQFCIVGRKPTPQVLRLANRAGVIVTGEVPDVRPYLEKSKVAVAPFRIARGVQNKILEAMSMELPVVGTPETFKGIAATDADGIRTADDPVTFARHVVAFLLADVEAQRCVAKQARSFVVKHHKWEEQGERLEQILIDAVEGKLSSMASEVKSAALA